MLTHTQLGPLSALEAKPTGHGKPQPILFIHGWWGGAWVWDRYLERFAAHGYHGYAVNLAGNHGSKPVSNLGRASFYDDLADVQAVVQLLDCPVVIGHSVGGLITQKLAEETALAGCVLLAPIAPRGILSLTTMCVMLPHLAAMVCQQPLLLPKRKMIAIDLNRLPAHEQEAVYARMVPAPGKQGIELGLIGVPVNADKITISMLAVAGNDDRLTPPALIRRIADKYKADLHLYNGHAHYLMREPGWESIADEIIQWMLENVED